MRRVIAKFFMITSLVLGAMPRVVSVFDLLQSPPVARVIITRRRRPEYAELFTTADPDERAAPRPAHRRAADDVIYRRVDTA